MFIIASLISYFWHSGSRWWFAAETHSFGTRVGCDGLVSFQHCSCNAKRSIQIAQQSFTLVRGVSAIDSTFTRAALVLYFLPDCSLLALCWTGWRRPASGFFGWTSGRATALVWSPTMAKINSLLFHFALPIDDFVKDGGSLRSWNTGGEDRRLRQGSRS